MVDGAWDKGDEWLAVGTFWDYSGVWMKDLVLAFGFDTGNSSR